MPLAAGTRLGPYEILGPLGAGGMGEVYRARDSRLNRDVAIKVLPEAFARDSERLARFAREAQTLASLNHTNIAHIHGLEEAGGVRALVMELVDGEDLSERIARGPIPLDEALPIARQILDALEAAHEQGIVHRDLKPANIKVRADGAVKVLDFGLAKAMDPVSVSGVNVMNSPTLSIHATEAGMIMGTAAYMSPEQAAGKAVDKRSDLWAFGVVFLEMLTGQPVFDGETVSHILASVLKTEPDWTTLPADTPGAVRRLLRRCLEKDRKRRLDSAADARLELDEAAREPAADAIARSNRPPHRVRTAAFALLLLLIGAAVAGTTLWITMRDRSTDASALVTRTLISVAPADELGGDEGRPFRLGFALSPNGRVLVFSAALGGRGPEPEGFTRFQAPGSPLGGRQLYQRHLDELDATAIAGTENAQLPFFSPDSQWLGYWADAELRKVPVNGGPAVVICKLPERTLSYGVSWGSDDRIVFGRRSGELWQVSASGGAPEALTKLDVSRGEVSHRLPHVLPGGDAVLFTITRNRFPRWDETEIAVHSRRTGKSTIVATGGADARYVHTGHIVYTREGLLMAAPFDLPRLAVTGAAVGIMSNLMQAAYHGASAFDSGAAQLSIADNGTAAYVPGGAFPPAQRTLVLVDRSGRVEPLKAQRDYYQHIRSSSDGQRFAVGTTGRNHDVWVSELSRGTFTRLTTTGRNSAAVWTPDGKRIVYRSTQTGPDNLFWRPAEGGEPERLTTSPRNQVAGAWTPDGKVLALYEISEERDALTYIWLLPSGAAQPARLTQGTFFESGVDFSPDGRWVAYASNESGQFQVYVQPYPGPGARVPISTDGGQAPVWRSNGQELFYKKIDPNGEIQMMAAPISTSPTLRAGLAQMLFRGRYLTGAPARVYDVMPDGNHFLMIQHDQRPAMPVSQIVLVQNWFEDLKARVPRK